MTLAAGRPMTIEAVTRAQRDTLADLLVKRGCGARVDGETRLVVDDCDRAAGGLARLVALVEDCRARGSLAEVTLELEGERRILRTET